MPNVIIRECNPDELGDDAPNDFEQAAFNLANAATLLLEDGGRSMTLFENLAAELAAFKAAAHML